MVDSAGGRYLARTSRTLHLEGDAPGQLIHLLIEWPSSEAAMEFYESAEYAPHRQQRQAGSHGDMWLVPGEDAAGLATLPSAGGGVH